jgi:hypothetical protein
MGTDSRALQAAALDIELVGASQLEEQQNDSDENDTALDDDCRADCVPKGTRYIPAQRSTFSLGGFGRHWLVNLVFVGAHFIRKREILLARLFYKSSFSPPHEESRQCTNHHCRRGKQH